MSGKKTLVINEVWRRTSIGNEEFLHLRAGVNLLVGPPNTGKTKWLETIDYLLGDTGDDPYSRVPEDDPLAEKYEAAGFRFTIGRETYSAERRWREPGGKSKVLLDEESLSAKEFQHFLMEKLEFPLLSAPSGNPFSGRTWPELSFRTLLRHFYRQQNLWGRLVDKQPDDTFRSCVQYFLGLAESLYTDDAERRVELTNEISRLQGRRDQFAETVSDIAKDFLDEESLSLSVTDASLRVAKDALEREYNEALERRDATLAGAVNSSEIDDQRSLVVALTEKRSRLVEQLSETASLNSRLRERCSELEEYKRSLEDEAARLRRADSASAVLSELRITHCPACSQVVSGQDSQGENCFLCYQALTNPEIPEEISKQRLDYEKVRLAAELKEGEELIIEVNKQATYARKRLRRLEVEVDEVERGLAPARQSLAALVAGTISSIDNELGSLSERLKQVKRLTAIFEDKTEIEIRIKKLQEALDPILERLKELSQTLDYSGRAGWLEDGMNDYLSSISMAEPTSWPHQQVGLYLSASTATFRVGTRRWDVSLGGTASLYYLMAYHFGLLSLQKREGARFPGFTMIDFPADFAGTKIGDAEDFVVQPFIDLLSEDGFDQCQIIVTGASFSGLVDVNRIELKQPFVS